jgi:hypothetical protein
MSWMVDETSKEVKWETQSITHAPLIFAHDVLIWRKDRKETIEKLNQYTIKP